MCSELVTGATKEMTRMGVCMVTETWEGEGDGDAGGVGFWGSL